MSIRIWTKERVFEESKKYTSRGEFKKGNSRAYTLARKNNWLNEMIWFEPSQKMKPNGYWTKERVFEESKKYKTFKEFKKGSIGAYFAAKKHGWFDEITWLKYEKNKSKPKGYWTKERVFEESKKYTSRSEFRKGSCVAYEVARKNNWWDDMPWIKML